MSKNKAPPVTSLDVILRELGALGKYNIYNYFLYLFPCFLAGMYASVYLFATSDVDYRCRIDACESLGNESAWLEFAIPKEDDGDYSKCFRYAYKNPESPSCTPDSFDKNEQLSCETFVYDTSDDSAVIDFDLGCQNWKRTLVGTFHNCGIFIALLTTGFVSDRYGRKVALPIAAIMNCIFGFLRSFSTSYSMLAIFEFLEPCLGAGAYTTAFVLAMELVEPKGRVLGNTLINIVFVFGVSTLAGLAWYIHNWRILLRVIYLPSGLILSYFFIMNESIRWLLTKGRYDEAIKVIKKAAKMNKIQLSEEAFVPLREQNKRTDVEVKTNPSSVFFKAFKSATIRKRVAACSYLWIACTFVYYGLSINSVALGGNKFLNFFLVSLVEIPANIFCFLFLDKFGRKKIMIFGYSTSAILCISLSFLPKGSTWRLLFYLFGKFTITVAYCSLYIYVSEVFPTTTRQSLLACCSALGRIGSMLAPLTPMLALKYENLPAIFFGGLAIFASILVMALPETINTHLPDTIEEAEMMETKKNLKEEIQNCA